MDPVYISEAADAPEDRVHDIRTQLTDMKGGSVFLKANLGRSKVLERSGTIIECHNEIFVIEVREKRNRTARSSYQYVDVLTKSVELYHADSGDAIFPWIETHN